MQLISSRFILPINVSHIIHRYAEYMDAANYDNETTERKQSRATLKQQY